MTTATANLTTIDIVGTMEHFAKWVMLQIVYLFIAFALMLLAPLLFTVGMQLMVHYCAASAPTWATIYFFAAPWFCAAWMAPVARWHDVVANWQAVKMGTRVKVTMQERLQRTCIGVAAMFIGLVGSYIAEFAFGYEAHRMGLIPHHLSLYFALAPFAVFAPCLLVVLYRVIRNRKQEGYIVG
jgi:hypothetical protein